ncbi:MAG: hypothetical protein K2X82_07080, partial [Gemmataceae bacterium]|nr:hypothetical protein [Gemmataceae bacterium]
PARPPTPPPRPALGMNLAGPADWNTELPFVDVFRLARPWVGQAKGKPWGQGPKPELDANGWVKRLEPGCWAEAPVCTITGGHYPAGDYVVLYDGTGKLEFTGAAKVKTSAPGRIVLTVDPKKGGFFVRLTATDPADPVRDVRVLMPGHERTYRDEPWNPAFLNLWRGVACLRFMDFMKTNDSEVAAWADRPTPMSATFSARGVPAELMVDLANRLDADPWFCMPHRADDDYVRKFAALVKEKLDPRRRVYVEYSNEVWNGQFKQNQYAAEQGKKLGLADKPWEAAWLYTARRSGELFALWGEAFGKDRLVRVLPSQAVNPYVSGRIAGSRDVAGRADVLAIAPYLGMNLGPQTKPSAGEVAGWSAGRVLDHVERHSLPEAVKAIRGSKAVADKYGLKLVAYEGGQHLVGVQGGENDEALTKVLHAANADPRMVAIYGKYLAAWEKEGGDLFCHFSSVNEWSKWGSWGLLQHVDDDPAKSPKFRAVSDWARGLGRPFGPAPR